ncbi:MAG TPA: hypothetical protein VMZ28_30670 [Kofleriaceae bacterium]|nr:hypothetical protein [Kofleriaceae bacterium]
MFMGATGLLACGGGGDDDGPQFPADANGDTPMACNPVTQQGCAEGEKCSWIVAQVTPTFLGQTACVRDGNVDLGGACSDNCIEKGSTDIGEACSETNAPDSTSTPPVIGTDDCKAGGVCINSVCTEVCQGQDTCGAENACVGYGDLFTDFEDVGACSPTCDPLAQDCGEGKGCYVDPFPGHGYATCEAELFTDRQQNALCPDDSCSLNGCSKGFGPWLSNAEDEIICTRISSAADTYLVDPDGDGDGVLAEGSDSNGGPVEGFDDSCEGLAVQNEAGLQSYFLQAFYGNTTDTPAEWGICAESGVDNGNCENWSMEFVFKTFDDAEASADPDTGMSALMELCSGTDRCGFSCTSNAKFEELAAAYCETPGEHPSCATEARSRISALRQASLKKPLPANLMPRYSRRHSW